MLSFIAKLRSVKENAGFTMIELLVVISVIGVLAVAVLSSINPIEQINKGRDTRLRSDAGQMLNAAERYFSIHEVYPWNETRAGTTNNTNFTPTATLYSDAFTFNGPGDKNNAAGTWNWTYQLSDTQEVKPAFTLRLINDSKLIVYRPVGSNSSTYVCFAPTSQAFKLEAAKNCNSTTATRVTPDFTYGSGTSSCVTTNGAVPTTGDNLICLP